MFYRISDLLMKEKCVIVERPENIHYKLSYNVKITLVYSNLLGVTQQIYVYTDHVKANFSPQNEILYVDSTRTSRLLEMEPETDVRKVY